MTTATRSELTAVLNHKGQQRFADAGATRQGKARPIKCCGDCGGYVVFAQNNAGKWYLADCFAYNSDTEAYYFRKDAAHHLTCGKRTEARNTQEEQAVAEGIDRKRAQAETAWMRKHMENGTWGEVTWEMCQAKIAEIAEQIK
jgi:hypothetical protein